MLKTVNNYSLGTQRDDVSHHHVEHLQQLFFKSDLCEVIKCITISSTIMTNGFSPSERNCAGKSIKMNKWKKMRIMNRNEKWKQNVKQNCKQNEKCESSKRKQKWRNLTEKKGKKWTMKDMKKNENETWKKVKKLLNTWEKEITGERDNGEKTVQTLVWWLDPDFLWRLDFWNPKTKQIRKKKRKTKGGREMKTMKENESVKNNWEERTLQRRMEQMKTRNWKRKTCVL